MEAPHLKRRAVAGRFGAGMAKRSLDEPTPPASIHPQPGPNVVVPTVCLRLRDRRSKRIRASEANAARGARPAFVPRTTETSQEIAGTAGVSNPQVKPVSGIDAGGEIGPENTLKDRGGVSVRPVCVARPLHAPGCS